MNGIKRLFYVLLIITIVLKLIPDDVLDKATRERRKRAEAQAQEAQAEEQRVVTPTGDETEGSIGSYVPKAAGLPWTEKKKVGNSGLTTLTDWCIVSPIFSGKESPTC